MENKIIATNFFNMMIREEICNICPTLTFYEHMSTHTADSLSDYLHAKLTIPKNEWEIYRKSSNAHIG